MAKKIVGFINNTTQSGNIGVNVSVMGEFSDWEMQNKKPIGQSANSYYISGVHLKETDIGKEVDIFFRKTQSGDVFCSGMKVK